MPQIHQKSSAATNNHDLLGFQRLHQDIIETMPSGIMVTNLDGVILLANPAALRCLRLDSSVPIEGKKLSSLVPGAEALLQNVDQGEQRRVILRLSDGCHRAIGYTSSLCPDGKLRITIFRDVGATTELVRMQTQIAESQERFRTIFEHMRSGVLLTDANGKVVLINPAALRQLHMPGPKNIVGRRLVDVVPGSEPLLENASREENRQIALTFPDGSRRTIGFSTRALETDGQRITVLRDLTPIIEAERRRRRTDQLAQVGLMAAKLSHEIKNPIASIIAGLQSVEREANLPSDVQLILGMIIGEARSLAGIVGRLLDSARPQPVAPKPIRVAHLIHHCLNTHLALARKLDIHLKIEPGPPDTLVAADKQAMGRILANLVQNSLEASPQDSWVTLGWRELAKSELKQRLPGFDGQVACLWVEDHGPGIPEELLERIFDPFVTTKSSGTGLGLSVVHDLVVSHGGIVEVQTNTQEPDRGSRFELLLPAGDRKPCHEMKPGCQQRDSCPVFKSGADYVCWTFRGQASWLETGKWDESCKSCEVFRSACPTQCHREDFVKRTKS